MTDRSVLLLEFNELCTPLVSRFMAEGKLPNFKRFYEQSHVYTTDAEEEQHNLEPWIQWVTVHTGLSYEEHGVFNLGDAHKLKQQSLWDILSDEGFKVWVCGSMNVRYQDSLNGAVLPDAWSTETLPKPSDLNHFFNFVRTNVQEHSNTTVPLAKADYIKFMLFLLKHGLSFDTVAAAVKQLASEQLDNTRWKRATLLDKIQWDVFAHRYQKEKPHFSTFFVNSVAHYQHQYWRNMEPEKFQLKPSDEEQAVYKDAILFGYQEMDKILGKAMVLAGDDTTIMLATALSQQPYLVAEEEGGKRFHRPHSFQQFIEFAGLTHAEKIASVMSEQFHIYFTTEAEAAQALDVLNGITVDGKKGINCRRDGNDVFAGCALFNNVAENAVIQCGDKSMPFKGMFYQAASLKSGMHNPEGFYWVRTPQKTHKEHQGLIPIRSIAPTVLSQFGIKPPEYMVKEALPLS